MDINKFTISQNQLIEDAIELIELNSSRCVIVINHSNKVVGVLSEGDILRAILKGVSIKSPIYNVMNPSYKYLFEKDENKIVELLKKGITLIPILNNQSELQDIVVYKDFISNKLLK
jgi:CBS domain-containing protein